MCLLYYLEKSHNQLKIALIQLAMYLFKLHCRNYLNFVPMCLFSSGVDFLITSYISVQAYGNSEKIRNNFVLDLLTYIGCGISLLGTISTIIALSVVR